MYAVLREQIWLFINNSFCVAQGEKLSFKQYEGW